MKSAASTNFPKRNGKDVVGVVPPVVEAPRVQAQLQGITSASGGGGKQGKETFPSVQAQLAKLRPLVNAKLQRGRTW